MAEPDTATWIDGYNRGVIEGQRVGRAERDAEVAAHLEAELDAMPEAEPFDEWWDGKAGALTDLLAWLEVGEVETPSPEPPADLELTREEIVEIVDREASRRYGLSAAGFVHCRAELHGAMDLGALIDLLPPDDELRVPPEPR